MIAREPQSMISPTYSWGRGGGRGEALQAEKSRIGVVDSRGHGWTFRDKIGNFSWDTGCL